MGITARFSLLGLLITFLILKLNTSNAEEDDGGFRQRGLKVHNYYRQMNRANTLQLDQELNKLAHARAEQLALWNNLTTSHLGFQENLWAHRGELLPLAKDIEYAVKCWYTASTAPGKIQASVDHDVLVSNFVTRVGFGVGTYEHNGEGYSVVVALYE